MFKRVLALIRKEFISIWQDPQTRLLIVLPPLLQLFIFAHAATMEVRNIDMAVLDKSNTVQSRELISKFSHSKWFRKIILVENENQIENMIRTQKVHLALAINGDFAKKLLLNKPADVQIIVDGRQTNVASIANGYANQIIAEYEAENFPRKVKAAPEINLDIRNWFNPNLIFLWYTVISLITILTTTIALVLTALSIAREREMGTFDQLIVSPLSSVEILIGKTVPPMVISVTLTSMMVGFAVFGFKIPFTSSIFLFYWATITYILSILGIGLFVSSICKTQQQAILGAFTFQMPAVLLSGYISPIEDMPKIFQHLTLFNPLRFYLATTKGLYLKSFPAIEVFHNLIPLMLIAALTLSLATWMFKKNLD